MIDIIYKIKNSQPTLDGDKAADIVTGVVTNPEWVVASSAVFEMDELLELTNKFISEMARVDIHGELLFTVQPIHVLYLDHQHLQDGWMKMWVLLYSNGAVCYSEKQDGEQPFLVLFMDETLVDSSQVVEIPLRVDSQ